MTRALLISLIFLVAGFLPTEASAQQPGANKAAAEALFQQGKDLADKKQYAEACKKFDASQRLEPAIGTLLFLGDCYEKQNKKASAWAAFKEASSLAQSRGDNRKDVAEVRAAALLPQVSNFVVRVSDESLALDGFIVRRDGVEMPPASFNAPLPVDAGKVEVEASAPGYRSWTKVIDIPDGGKTITVDVPALVAAGEADPDPDPSTEVVPPPVPKDPGQDGDSTGTALLIAGVGVGVLGVAGVVVGAIFGASASSDNDESLTRCRTPNLCSPEGLALREDAQSAATISTITFIVGGVLVAGGVTLVVLSQTVADDETAEGRPLLEVVPAVSPEHAGLSLRGSW